jgi:hypothetical protein
MTLPLAAIVVVTLCLLAPGGSAQLRFLSSDPALSFGTLLPLSTGGMFMYLSASSAGNLLMWSCNTPSCDTLNPSPAGFLLSAASQTDAALSTVAGNTFFLFYATDTNYPIVAVCSDAACSSPSTRVVEAAAGQWGSMELVLGVSVPVFFWYDSSLPGVRSRRCSDDTCTGFVAPSSLIGPLVNVRNIDTALSNTNLPLVVYENTGSGAITLLICSDIDCSGSNIVAVTTSGSDPVVVTSGTVTGPSVVYYSLAGVHVHVCGNSACTDPSSVTIDVGQFAWLSAAVEPSTGRLVVFYVDATSGSMRYLWCGDMYVSL